MSESVDSLPLLANSEETLHIVRFLTSWMDAAPRTPSGRIHHYLLCIVDEESRRAGKSLAHIITEKTFQMERLSEIVQWLSENVSRPFPQSPPFIQRALAHVMSDKPEISEIMNENESNSKTAVKTKEMTLTERLLSAVRSTEYRGTLVILLFHARMEIRFWARETLLRLLASTISEERVLWLMGLQLLCTIQHLSGVPLDARDESARMVIADGFSSLLAILTVIDKRLGELERVLIEKQEKEGKPNNQNLHQLGNSVEAPFGGVSSATVLLLGGSMVLYWMLSATVPPSTSPSSSSVTLSAHPLALGDAIQLNEELDTVSSSSLLMASVNVCLGSSTTLQPFSLATDTRRSLVKAFVHTLLSNANGCLTPGDMSHCRRRLRGIWRSASQLDAPPPIKPNNSGGSTLGNTSLPAKSAGWLLRILFRNGSTQLNLQAVIRPTDSTTLRKSETASAVFDELFSSLTDTLPGLAASRHYHDFLKYIEKDCVSLAVAVARRSPRPELGVALLRHFMRADMAAFSRGQNLRNTGLLPPDCLRTAWEVLPDMLQRSTTERSVPARAMLHAVMESLDVVVRPSVCAWLLMKELRDGPPPLAWAVGRCMDRLTDVLRGSMRALRQLWESNDTNMKNHNPISGSYDGSTNSPDDAAVAAASRLLSAGSPIPRVAHVLMLSRDAAPRRLGDAMSSLFLRSLGSVAQITFRADAANWLLRVILDDPLLSENALKLHDAKVDASARADGTAWVTVMCGCNWSNLPPDVLAAAWWLCALVADVCVLDQTLRDPLLDSIVSQLPPIPEDIDANPTSNNEAVRESRWLARRPLRECAQHLLLVLVQKSSLYSPAALTGAVLHIASAIPPLRPSGRGGGQQNVFRKGLATALLAAVQRLPEGSRGTLFQYAPAWLAEMLQTTRQTIDECVEDQNRRFQQYELEDRRLQMMEEADKKRTEQEEVSLRVNRELRKEEMRVERENMAKRTPLTEILRATEVKRPRRETLQLLHAMSSTELAPATTTPKIKGVTSATAPTVASTAAARRNDRRLDEVLRAEGAGRAAEALQRVAGRTDLLCRPPRIDDIIGHDRHCLAVQLPTVPQRFPATRGGRELYVAVFLPHIALELRYEVLARFDEVLDACRARGTSILSPLTGHSKASSSLRRNAAMTLSVQSVGKVQGEQNHTRHGEFNAVAPWVMESTTAVIAAGEAVPNLIDPTQMQFGIAPRDMNALSPLSSSISDGDLVLLLMPLPRIAAALPHTLRGVEIPSPWRLLGCVPQLCLASSVLPGNRGATLTVFAPLSPTTSPTPQAYNGSTMKTATTTNVATVAFSHALQAFRVVQDHFYLRRLFPLGSTLAAATALHDIGRSPFAATLLEPHLAAPAAVAYYSALDKLLASASWPSVMREMMLLHSRLNEWQIRAVAAALFAVVPRWTQSFPSTALPSTAPPLLIVEGPPGTGKTQTIAAMALNLLRHLLRAGGSKSGTRLLICAPSNCAVDEVLLRLLLLVQRTADIGTPQMLRVGVKDSIDAAILAANPPLFLDDCVEMLCGGGGGSCGGGRPIRINGNESRFAHSNNSNNENNNKRNTSSIGGDAGVGSNRQCVREQLLRTANIVCSTLGSLGQIQRLDSIEFDVVIVDEASQGTEPDVVQALLFAKRHAILVGDANQLQPTILSPVTATHGLRRSVLQRLLCQGSPSSLLRKQYRMHPDICAFPNKYFYDGKLLTDSIVLTRQRTAALPLAGALLSVPRFVFVDVPEGRMGWGRGHSMMNRLEAEALVRQMRCFRSIMRLSPEVFARHVGIITFYRAQREAIVQLFSREERATELHVSTVDSFQGKEKDIIFISCVRAPKATAKASSTTSSAPNDSRSGVSLGFVEDWHRINVALTRAKEFCIVFGHQETFRAAAAATATTSVTRPDSRDGNIFNAYEERCDDDDEEEEEVQVMEMSKKSDDDPLVLDRLVQHAATNGTNSGGENGAAALFRNSSELNVVKELLTF